MSDPTETPSEQPDEEAERRQREREAKNLRRRNQRATRRAAGQAEVAKQTAELAKQERQAKAVAAGKKDRILRLIALLPAPGSVFPHKDRAAWATLVASAFDDAYGVKMTDDERAKVLAAFDSPHL